MATSKASALRARRTLRTVKVYDMATGALIRTTTTRGEIARALAKYDALRASDKMTKRAHDEKVRTLTAMLRVSFDRAVNTDDETVAVRADSIRATRDYEGVWNDEFRTAFGFGSSF